MSNLNQCNFIGRLGQDPEQKYMPNGKAVVNLSIAVSEKWKDQQGQQQESTEWVRVTAYDKLAEIIGQYVTKGSLIYISGKMKTRKWQDQQGNDKYTTEIIANQMQMLGGNDKASGQQQAPKQQQRPATLQPAQSGQQGNYNNAPDDEFDSEIPF